MASYRLYWIDADNRISHARNAEFESDDDALAGAQRRVGEFPAVEVWQAARLVGRVYATSREQSAGTITQR